MEFFENGDAMVVLYYLFVGKMMDSLPSVENDVGDDIALADLLISFLSSVGFGDVHEGGGERVVGNEGGCKANDGK